MNKEEQWLLEEKYNGVKSPEFLTDCERLASGEPLGYIIGHVPFLDTTIHLDNHPLIPRVETEFWVEKAIAEIRRWQAARPEAAPHILDLCAGSGAIGVAVAKAVPEAIVHFAEIDAHLLPTIAKNLEANDIPCTRYRAWQSDLYEHIDGQFDFILSNPPYIDPALDRTQVSVKNFEPHLALYGGHQGLELIEKIIAGARAKLAPTSSQLWLEHEPEQTEALQELATKNGLTTTTHTDQYNTPRYSILTVAQ